MMVLGTSAQAAGVFKDADNNMFLDATKKGHSDDVAVQWTWTWQKEWLIDVVRNVVNRVLGILALIALIILLWWGFQMVTSAGDEGKFDNWFKILKNAAFGLVMIWVAWFVVSLIFFVINTVTT
jgi:hypothetical protein